jgi:hypothetical protein
MARTDAEIQASLIESLRAVDPSVDVEKGPIYDFLLRPVPTELQKTEAEVERLTILTTLQLDEVATDDEIAAMANSFSIRLGGGKASKLNNQLFFTFTRPTQDIVIDRGQLIGSVDQRYTYFVTERAVLPAATADNFFNPQTRRYEISVRCEATAVGPDFDLPPTRVNRILSTIDGIDGTINNDRYEGGALAETLTNSVDRVRAKFAGLDPESGGGIKSDLRNFDAENVLDVQLVYPKDRALFKRQTNRPAVDAYVLGDDIQSTTETFVSVGGETTLALTSLPVTEVIGVLVNNVGVTFSFIQDKTRALGYSARAADYVLLDTPLIAADIVVVEYNYNKLLSDAQSDLFSLERPFDTDVLVRAPRPIGIAIHIDASVLASFDPARVFVAIENTLFEEVESSSFIDVLQPEVLRQRIRESVAGLASLRFTLFRRTSGSAMDVETVTLEKNEVSFIDQAALNIQVRR